MTRSRAADWLIGAMGMLVLLIIAAIVLWWLVSAPATPTNPSPTATRTADSAGPPDDLGENETWLGDVDVRSDLVVLPSVSLTNIQAQGHGARSSDDGVVVEHLEVTATIPFADVAAKLGGDSKVSAGEDGQASIERTVQLLDRELRIVATGTVEARDGLLVVEPLSIDAGGPDALSKATAAVVRQLVTLEQPIDGLPENLVLREVTVQEDGFRARLDGTNVVLSEG